MTLPRDWLLGFFGLHRPQTFKGVTARIQGEIRRAEYLASIDEAGRRLDVFEPLAHEEYARIAERVRAENRRHDPLVALGVIAL